MCSRRRPIRPSGPPGCASGGRAKQRSRAARLVGREGRERQQFLSGEPFSLRLRIEAENGIAPPQLQLELRDEAGLLLASDVLDTARVGWADGQRELRYDVDRLPLSDGRFHLRLGLADATSDRVLHWLDDALTFLVYPAGEERGVVRLEGSWAAEQNSVER